MRKWTDRRLMQIGFYLAALALPFFFAFRGEAANFNAQFVTVVVVFCICAGFLSSSGNRATRDAPPKGKAPRDGDDDDSDAGGPQAAIDPLVRKVREVVRKHRDWPMDRRRVAALR